MEIITAIRRWWGSSIIREYLPILLLCTILFLGLYFLLEKTHPVVGEIGDLAQSISCDISPIPSIGTTKESASYRESFETYTKKDLGFSFQYPPYMKVSEMRSATNHEIILSYREDTSSNGQIIVSVDLNDKNLTPEEWLLGHDSGYLQSRDNYGNCYKTDIDEQGAVYTDGGMWTIVNTPDNEYRLDITNLATGKSNTPFTEMGIVVGSLDFIAPDIDK